MMSHGMPQFSVPNRAGAVSRHWDNWQSSTPAQLLGTPQGTFQGIHAGATAALPILRFMEIAYRGSAVQPFRFPGLMWVDHTIVILEGCDTCPIRGVLLDQQTYYQGVLRVDVPDLKI